MKRHIYTFLILLVSVIWLFGTGCQPKKSSDSEEAGMIQSGDIIVSNSGADSVLLFDSTGVFKDVIFEISTVNGEAITGISENTLTGEILIAVDGTPDRVMAVKKSDLTSREFIRDATNFTGTIRGIAYLTSGDTLAVETSNLEKFDSMGYRVTTGSWPKALQTTGSGVDALTGGGFIHCSTGSDVIRTYDATGTQVATLASGIAATTDAADCKTAPDGDVVVAWSGTTDTVRKYSSSLAATTWSYSSLTILSTPSGIAVRANGNVLAMDSVLNHVVEIAFDGTNAVGTIMRGDAVDIDDMLGTPQFIWVVK
ncbi:hypothetical protein [Bdellovibrio sp. HCB337]|uniref:hypothetical protein n=1 Tax=Bdellovibrio sp. HCB337 TaxID=3394358 RepID=UPI0039A71243